MSAKAKPPTSPEAQKITAQARLESALNDSLLAQSAHIQTLSAQNVELHRAYGEQLAVQRAENAKLYAEIRAIQGLLDAEKARNATSETEALRITACLKGWESTVKTAKELFAYGIQYWQPDDWKAAKKATVTLIEALPHEELARLKSVAPKEVEHLLEALAPLATHDKTATEKEKPT